MRKFDPCPPKVLAQYQRLFYSGQHRERVSCGFSDVRRRKDGRYYCPVCKAVMPEDYETNVRTLLPRSDWKQLKAQCAIKNGPVTGR